MGRVEGTESKHTMKISDLIKILLKTNKTQYLLGLVVLLEYRNIYA